MPGIMPDADTRALYKFDEVSVPGTGYATAVDAVGPGTRNLAETVPAPGATRDGRYSHIVNGPNANRYARWFPGNVAVYLARNGDSTVANALKASWSFECWLRADVLSGQQDIVQYGGLDDAEANNHLFSFHLNGSTIRMFWESGAGTNQIITPAGSTMNIVAGTWYHVAITVDNSGGTSTIKFYLDGVLKDTQTGITKATGGTNTANFWRVGGSVNGANAFRGAIKDVRFSTVVRDGATIAADAAIATCEHPLDGSTLVLWRFNEAPDAIDETDYGYHARKMQGTIEITEPLLDDNGLARHLSADCEYAAHAQYEALRSMFLGNWSWDGWFRMDTGYALADRGWWIFGVSGSELEVNNTVATDIMSTANGRQFRCWVETGAGLDPGGGTDTGITSTDPLLDAVADGYNRHHIAVTKTQNGSNTEWRLYLDGVLVEMQTSPFSNNYSGGTGADNMLRMGAGGAAGFSGGLTTNTWLGSMDNMRWTARALTADEIAEIFEGTPPTITLVSPPEGAIASDDPIVVDVLDDTFIASGTAQVTLPDGTTEIAWLFFDDELGVVLPPGMSEFPVPYAFASKAPAPSGIGWRVTFERTGGWPAGDITLGVAASDGSLGDAAVFEFGAAGVVPEPEVPAAASPPAGIQGDLRLTWGDGLIDASIEDDDLAVDLGLRTSVLLSLFIDRRAEDDDALPGEDEDRRGWWGDELAAQGGDLMGSRLWLLDRSKRQADVVQRAEEMVREALAWMIEDRVAEKLDVDVEATGQELRLAITAHRPKAEPVTFRFSHVWEAST